MAVNLKRLYERHVGGPDCDVSYPEESGRNEYLDAAEEVASLTLPDTRPKGRPIDRQPYSSLPGKFVRGISSRVVRSMFPSTTDWYEYQYETEIEQKLAALGDDIGSQVRGELDNMLAHRRTLVNNYIAQRQVQARLARLLRRLMIEGQNGVQVLADRVRIHPLRSLAVKRHSGELIYWIIKEEKRKSFRELESADYHVDELFTLVDVINDEIVQQTNDGTSESVKKTDDGGDVRQYILPSVEIPDCEDYVYGFAWHFKGLLNEIDNMAASLGEATANAAWAVLLVHPLANVTQQEIRDQWVSGSAAIANKDHFQWLTSGVKLNDFQFVAQYLNDLRQDGREIFLDEDPSGDEKDVTATAILRRVERIDRQTADLLVSLDTTLQHPLVPAVEAALGLSPLTDERFGGPIRVAVTTGTSALQQDMRSMRGIQKIQVAKSLDDLLIVNGATLLEEAGRGDGFNYKRVVSRVDPAALAAAQQQEAAGGGATPQLPPGTVSQGPGGPQPEVTGQAESNRREQMRIPASAA